MGVEESIGRKVVEMHRQMKDFVQVHLPTGPNADFKWQADNVDAMSKLMTMWKDGAPVWSRSLREHALRPTARLVAMIMEAALGASDRGAEIPDGFANLLTLMKEASASLNIKEKGINDLRQRLVERQMESERACKADRLLHTVNALKADAQWATVSAFAQALRRRSTQRSRAMCSTQSWNACGRYCCGAALPAAASRK